MAQEDSSHIAEAGNAKLQESLAKEARDSGA